MATSLITIPRRAAPSYKAGYARSSAESANPGLWDGLVGAWVPALGVSSGTLYDISGHGGDGTLTNLTLANAWVIQDGEYVLDYAGANDYVDLPSHTFTSSDHWSLVWTAKKEGGTNEGMLTGERATSPNWLWMTSSLQFRNSASNSVAFTSITDFSVMHEYAIVCDGSSISAYVDGLFVSTKSITTTFESIVLGMVLTIIQHTILMVR